jgi:hypothetical protein
MPPICQTTPSHLNVNRSFQKRGWQDDQETDSIPGYQKYGREWFAVLTEANRATGRHFQWLVNINATTTWSVDEIKKKKAQLMKNLGRPETAGLSAFWRLQINNENRDLIHFHFMVLDGFSNNEQRIMEVFKKAAKPLGLKTLRFHVEEVDLQHSYLGYVLKMRPEDKDKIVLWAKELPRFTRAGVIRYPWPPDWDSLPAVSATHKGGMAKRFRKRRNRVARVEEDTLSYWITPQYRQHLKTLTGKSDYEIRKVVLENREFWEQQCDSWHSQRPPDTGLKERLDQINAELLECFRKRNAERKRDHHHSSPTGLTTGPGTTTLQYSGSVPMQPQEPQQEKKCSETVTGPRSMMKKEPGHSRNRHLHRSVAMNSPETRCGRECNETMATRGSFTENRPATDALPAMGCSP